MFFHGLYCDYRLVGQIVSYVSKTRPAAEKKMYKRN